MSRSELPLFPYGAVYFRKSNPPRKDWAQDYQTASEDGMTAFRHWFLWSAIEVAPGKYDWSEYDRQLDLAAEHGIKTIIAELVTVAPEWIYRAYPHARYETREGRFLNSGMHGSCVVGGAPGLCLDNEDVRSLAERFLHALVTRYRDHPGLGWYDIWNECNHRSEICFCPATAARFREWLRDKYGDLLTLGQAWHRYSYVDWEDIVPPRHMGGYPDVLDWLQFRVDNAFGLMRWRADLFRSLDDIHPVTAHGVAASLTQMAARVADDWRAAAEVESYGLTWGSSRHGDEPWKQMHAVDLVRASCRGKPFWHAEAYAGPLWMQPQVIDKPRNEGRIASPEDIRYWDLVSFMGGAQGLMYLRWRPLLDGPLFGAFGPYGMDGSRTDRSEMVSCVAKWVSASEQADLWRSTPVQGTVGILFVPETQMFLYAQQGNTDYYARSMQGVYQGFHDLNVQADWVHIDDVKEYDFLYLPCPVMLKQETVDRLKAWVKAGGMLVSEGCPGYFGQGGHVDPVQPGWGMDELFGARESYVEFTPDLLDGLIFHVDDTPVRGGIFLQAYEATAGTAVGVYADGQVAAVDHVYGKGRTRLLGTMPGYGYATHPGERSPDLFADLLDWAGKTQHIVSSDARIKARLHDGAGGIYLWVANPTRQDLPVRLVLSDQWGPFTTSRSLWGAEATVDGRVATLRAGARDVAVIALE